MRVKTKPIKHQFPMNFFFSMFFGSLFLISIATIFPACNNKSSSKTSDSLETTIQTTREVEKSLKRIQSERKDLQQEHKSLKENQQKN